MARPVGDTNASIVQRLSVLFVVIGQPDLVFVVSSEPTSIQQMYRTTAAQETLHRRELLLDKLRHRGALTLEVNSATASVALVNSYLDVKQRGLL